MKSKFVFLLLMSSLLMLTTCSDNGGINEEIETPPINLADCGDSLGFVSLYSLMNKGNDAFVVKGVFTGELVNGQARELKIIEDLKGNLKGTSSILLWGHGGDSQTYNEFGASLRHYAKNDTLIVMFGKNIWEKENGTSETYYASGGCGYSILKFSKGNVTGIILSDAMLSDAIQEPLKEDTISLEELLSLLFIQQQQ